MPLLKKERSSARVVDVHAAREVGSTYEAVRQRERELADRVRAGLRDVVAEIDTE